MARKCGAGHTGASQPTSYKSSRRRGKQTAHSGFEVMAIAADRKALRTRIATTPLTPRDFSLASATLLAVGAPVGVVRTRWSLRDVLDRRRPRSDRLGAGRRARVFDRFMRPFAIPAFVVLLAGSAWAALCVVDALSGRGRELLRMSVLLAATLRRWWRRGKTRAPPTFICSHRPGRRHGDHGRAGPRRDLDRRPDDGRLAAGAVAIAVLLFPAMAGSRRADATVLRGCFYRRLVLRLYRQLRAAHHRRIRRLSGVVV